MRLTERRGEKRHMKINLIGQALDEIKEEDQNNLSELESKVKELESECSSKDNAVEELQKEYSSLEELDYLMGNTLKHLHMIMPVVEIPLGVFICGVAFSSMISGAMILGMIALAVVCEVDAIKTLIDHYPKILGRNNSGFQAYIDAFKRLFLSKRDVRALLIKTYDMLLDTRSDALIHSRKLLATKDEADMIKGELLHLEGYISSIEYIIERQYFDELKDTTDIVQFINKKRELKKVVND